MKRELHRRAFMGVAASAVTASLLTSCTRAPSPWRFLTETEAELVDLITEQIIPRDEDPGAIDAGVVNFIDKQLAGPYERHQVDYRTGLAGVQETAQSLYGKKFAELAWEEQTRVLQSLESGKAPGRTWETASSSAFFELIRDHTMQGFYGSPRHGGNKDYVSFRMLGLDYPQIIGQNRYL
jgi:gluconate 2-dehydrogenase gamma chain